MCDGYILLFPMLPVVHSLCEITILPLSSILDDFPDLRCKWLLSPWTCKSSSRPAHESPWHVVLFVSQCFSGANSHIYILYISGKQLGSVPEFDIIWHHLTSFDIIWSYLPKYSGTRWTRFRYQLLSESPIFAVLATCQKTRDLWREVSTTEEDSELSSLSSEEVSAATWNDHPPTYKN